MGENLSRIIFKTPECHNCQGLCCVAYNILDDKKGLFKPAGEICKHLDCKSGACGIYENRNTANLSVCEGFNCLGAGELVSNWAKENIPNFNRLDPPTKDTPKEIADIWNFNSKIIDRVFMVVTEAYMSLKLISAHIIENKDDANFDINFYQGKLVEIAQCISDYLDASAELSSRQTDVEIKKYKEAMNRLFDVLIKEIK